MTTPEVWCSSLDFETRAPLSFLDRRPRRTSNQEQCSHLFAPLSFRVRMSLMPSAPRTARALARAELTRQSLDRASVQLAEVGPAALSVRQIARELEMASSAVYRYFPSRD